MHVRSLKKLPRFISPRFETTRDYDILIKRHNSAKDEYIKTVRGHQLNRILDTLEEKRHFADFES